jgi:hypothetical protein
VLGGSDFVVMFFDLDAAIIRIAQSHLPKSTSL